MAFSWEEFLNLAAHLALGGHGLHPEASSRSAVSRAYYAAYCYARNHARDNEGFVPTGTARDHVRLRDHFSLGQKTQLADDLEDLRIWRNDCDYEDVVTNLPTLLKSALKRAKDVLDALP